MLILNENTIIEFLNAFAFEKTEIEIIDATKSLIDDLIDATNEKANDAKFNATYYANVARVYDDLENERAFDALRKILTFEDIDDVKRFS